jgi:hypothetical protein
LCNKKKIRLRHHEQAHRLTQQLIKRSCEGFF